MKISVRREHENICEKGTTAIRHYSQEDIILDTQQEDIIP